MDARFIADCWASTAPKRTCSTRSSSTRTRSSVPGTLASVRSAFPFHPGLSYVLTPEEVRFLQRAVVFVSEFGWKFLPEYVFYEDTAEWRHRSIKNKKPFRRWLNDVSFLDGSLHYVPKAKQVPGLSTDPRALEDLFSLYFQQAEAQLAKAEAAIVSPNYVVSEYKAGNVKNAQSALVEAYRWYVTPIEAYQDVRSRYQPTHDEPVLEQILIQVRRRAMSSIQNQTGPAEPSQPASAPNSDRTPSNSTSAPSNPSAPSSTTPPNSTSSIESLKRPSTPGANPFAVKVSAKKPHAASCAVSASGRAIVPLSVVSMVQEEGVEFHYTTGVDGTLEFTAVVPGMSFSERVRYMKAHKELFPAVPNRLMKLVGQAIGHFEMLREGDRVMLGLSGGKDSLTMLHCLLQLQRRSPTKFELACVTVDPQTTGFDPR